MDIYTAWILTILYWIVYPIYTLLYYIILALLFILTPILRIILFILQPLFYFLNLLANCITAPFYFLARFEVHIFLLNASHSYIPPASISYISHTKTCTDPVHLPRSSSTIRHSGSLDPALLLRLPLLFSPSLRRITRQWSRC